MTTSKPTNILLWDFSLKNPENILDEYYFHDVTHLVIPTKKSESDTNKNMGGVQTFS